MKNVNLRTRGPYQHPSELMLQWLEEDQQRDWSPILDLLASGTHVTNPYHNMTHMLNVAWYARHIYRTSASSADWVPHKEAVVITSALLHDFDHSGGYHKNDATNIASATALFKTVAGTEVMRDLNFNGEAIQSILDNIKCTQYDAVNKMFPREPQNDMQKALRDADLMSLYSREGRQLLVGLYYEIYGKPFMFASLDEAKAYARAQYDFNSSVRMYTDYGQRMQQQQFVRSARDMLSVLGSENYGLAYTKVADVIPELAVAIPPEAGTEDLMQRPSVHGGHTLQ